MISSPAIVRSPSSALPVAATAAASAAAILSQPLDDVCTDVTNAHKPTGVCTLSPVVTPEGFPTPSPGSPASFRIEMVKFAHRFCTPLFSHNEGNSGAFFDGGKIIRESGQHVHS